VLVDCRISGLLAFAFDNDAYTEKLESLSTAASAGMEIEIRNERELTKWEGYIRTLLQRHELDYVLGGLGNASTS
jgi:hypothetical protein